MKVGWQKRWVVWGVGGKNGRERGNEREGKEEKGSKSVEGRRKRGN